MNLTNPFKTTDATTFLEQAVRAFTTDAVERLIASLPIVGDDEYVFHAGDPSEGWREG